MKLQYKLGIMALGIAAFTSCEKHDPFDDHVEPGQLVPTCYWEVASTAVKAGEEFSFTGKYYAEGGNVPSQSQVWYSINQANEASATLKLCGSYYSYTQTVASKQEIRTSQAMAVFPHGQSTWDGYEYVITGKVPTSSTLAPVSWMPKVWDQANYDRYFTPEFTDSFLTVVKTNLLDEKGNFPAALQNVYVSYGGFTNEYMTLINETYSVNFPTNVEEGVTGKTKSDFWHFIKDTDKKTTRCYAVVSYSNATGESFKANYDSLYKVAHTKVGRETVNKLTGPDSLLYEAMTVNPSVISFEGQDWYATYQSSEWLNCRYEPSAAAILTAVKSDYVDAVNEMLNSIPFDEWVYNKTDQNYAVSFTRKYTLDSSFKVVDTADNVGVASTNYTLDVN